MKAVTLDDLFAEAERRMNEDDASRETTAARVARALAAGSVPPAPRAAVQQPPFDALFLTEYAETWRMRYERPVLY